MTNFRGFSVKAVAAIVGGLAIVVGGGGVYYYYVYLPQMEKTSAAVAHQTVKSPAVAKPAKQPVAPPVQPGVVTENDAATIAAAVPLVPVLELTQEPVKAKPAVRKSVSKRRGDKRLTAQPAKMDSGHDVPATNRQLTSPLPAVLPESGAATESALQPKIIILKYNDILTAVLRSDKDAVKQLLDFGRWVDKPGSSGLTPLMAAVMNQDAQMVKLLLEHGAEPSVLALKLARKNKDVASVLLLEQHGALIGGIRPQDRAIRSITP